MLCGNRSWRFVLWANCSNRRRGMWSQSPLAPMDAVERLHADFQHTGLTIGNHPDAVSSPEMNELGVFTAARSPESSRMAAG